MPGEGTGGKVLCEVLRGVVTGVASGGTEEVTFVKDSGAERRGVEGSDGEKTGRVLCGDVKVAIALGNGIGVKGSGREVNGTWMVWCEGDIVVEEFFVTSTGHEGTSVHESTGCIDVFVFGEVFTVHVGKTDDRANVGVDGMNGGIENVHVNVVIIIGVG